VSGVEIVLDRSAPDDSPGAGGGVAVTLGERGSKRNPAVVVVHVAPGSHAEQSGLVPGDRLTRIANRAPGDMSEARRLLNGPVGSEVVVEVERGGRRLTLQLLREQVRR
jgi:C-terminal processing protease CtpA/Prc